MHVDIHGQDGPTIVFVHGFACSGEDWRMQVAAFGQSHQVVVPDLCGHGLTRGIPIAGIAGLINDTAELVEGLAPGWPCMIVGHSMGCRIALGVAAAVPDRIHGVVFLDGSWVGNGDADVLATGVADRLAATGVRETMEAVFAQMFTPDSDPDLRDQIVGRALTVHHDMVRSLMPDIFRWDALHLPATVSNLSQPVLAIQSTHVNEAAERVPVLDSDVPWLNLLRGAVSDLTIRVLPGGHFSMLEQADGVNAAISAFYRDKIASVGSRDLEDRTRKSMP